MLKVIDKLWVYRKLMTTDPVTARDEILYAQLVERINNTDIVSAQGIIPPTISVIQSIDVGYFLNELETMKSMPPQQRGYRFEGWLNELFSAFRLSPNAGFRITGEQIDGSFNLHNETYLIEAKWHNQKTSALDLHVFQGKLTQKATWTRGVFISWQGFSPDALNAWGNSKSVICVTGYDLYHMLLNNISLIDMLERKIRIAAERGEYYVSIDKLYPGIIKAGHPN
ncbi:restriction endonuclease family protein [Serratia marcescens]|nr:restriction endonuclease family protein [Serratia marcescens]